VDEIREFSMRRTKILICSSELGAGKRGASLGPDAIRISAVNLFYNLFDQLPVNEINVKKINRFSPGQKSAKYIKTILSTHRKICRKVASELEAGYDLLIFTGDHSNAAGFVAGFREAYKDQKIGLIWIDAHGDLHSPYTSPSGNMHGMPVAMMLGYDNIEHKRRTLKPEVVKNWEKIKRTGKSKISPKLSPEDIVFIGIRDLEEQEWSIIKNNSIKYYGPEHIKQKTIQTVIDETKAHFEGYDAVYISFDVDSMDPSISEGTGTPVPDGLTVKQAQSLLRSFSSMPNCKAVEITEVNPLLDTQNRMANVVVKLLRDSLEFE
jgi:arginase